MLKFDRVCAMLGAAAVLGAWPVRAEPPALHRAIPNHADVVGADLSELRFEFDQPMSTAGQSICGGGATFPTLTGRVRWEDDRTLVLPVRLEPGRTYQLSLNCPSASGIRGASGEALPVTPIQFRTLGEGEAAPALAPGEADAALGALRVAIDERYSYRDLRGVDWARVLNAAAGDVGAAETPAELARVLARCLAAAEDVHVSVGVDGVVIGTHRVEVTPNIDPSLLVGVVPSIRQPTPRVAEGAWDDGVRYLLVGSWGAAGMEQDLPAILAAIDRSSGAPGLIIDVRPNSGGDELFARRVAARLATRGAVYSRSLLRDPNEPDGFSGPFERRVEPDAGRPDGFEPPRRIAVLIGPACMSSNESFIHMVRTACGARLFGARTYGSSGNPRPHDLGAGVTVVLPSWQDVGPDGVVLEGVGIEPDEAVEWRDDGSDRVLEAALAWVRGAS